MDKIIQGTIYGYRQFFRGKTICYCENHARWGLFNNKEKRIKQVRNHPNGDIQVDDDGVLFRVIHEGTLSQEEFPGQIVPLEGIQCSACNTQIYPPREVTHEQTC